MLHRLLIAISFIATYLSLVVSFGISAAEIELPLEESAGPIRITAARGQHWQQGAYEVWVLQKLDIRQGVHRGKAEEGVLWIERTPPNSDTPSKVISFLEGEVELGRELVRADAVDVKRIFVGPTWFGRWHTWGNIDLRVASTSSETTVRPSIYKRAVAARDRDRSQPVRRAQFAEGAPAEALPATDPNQTSPFIRSIRIESQGSAGFSFRTVESGDPNETIAVCDSGVHIVIEGISNVPDQYGRLLGDLSVVDIVTDRIVVWTDDLSKVGLPGGRKTSADPTFAHPVEFYMEGNIVFRQGDRVIYADRMYYNVTEQRGVVLNAEMLTPVPGYQGLVRLKADVLQQATESTYIAHGAAMTSSRLGVPRYWFQSETVEFRDTQQPAFDPLTGQPRIDAQTGEAIIDHRSLATSKNNWVYLGGVPVFYWPTIATDLQEPSYYVERIQIKNDSVFGTQLLLDFDAYQLFGIRSKPPGSEWQISTDVLSERGFGIGTNFRYQNDTLLGIPGPYRGVFDAWGLRDSGLDNLGSDRRALVPEADYRGRVFGQHRHNMPNDFQFSAELGLISDRNFLEQYYEREWDQNKDQTTGLELKKYIENQSLSLTTDVRVNDFFTQTEWLPRADHFLLGKSLLFDKLTLNSHSSVGYAKMKTATTPTDPVDAAKFQLLEWEADREGLRAATRNELSLPLDLGPVRVVPYVLGEMATWGEDLSGESITRGYGQAGLRSSLPIWRADNSVRNDLLYLNGLAHKITLESDIYYADASEDIDRFPLYDPLNDDSLEHFQRRLYFNTFNGAPGGYVPLKFDDRYYALRSGMQGWVTSPSTEIADDLTVARLGLSQRWQTKRGLPGQQRIIDWIVFDVHASLFPNADRDNFGESVGLIDYDFRWHIGDRFTLLSDGFADVFSSGLRTASIGGIVSRPEMGSLYVGFRTIDGPVQSNAVTATANYRMNEKWILTAGSSYDFASTGNIGQILNLTRVGESFLIKLGFNWDVSRGNVGVNFSIEPRLLPSSKLGRVGGVQIPPAGVLGLE